MIFKNDVLLAWELNFRDFLFFRVICVFWGRLENSSFTCMGVQFWRSRSAILRFFVFFENAKNQVFANLAFSRFFIMFGTFWEAFWLSFGFLLESPASFWRAGVILLALFGLPEPSVGSLCYFLWCLWLVRIAGRQVPKPRCLSPAANSLS